MHAICHYIFLYFQSFLSNNLMRKVKRKKYFQISQLVCYKFWENFYLIRFIKRHFVRDKNPQQLDGGYIIQYHFLNMNMNLLLKNNQRSPNGGQFPFQWIYVCQISVHHFKTTKITCDVTMTSRERRSCRGCVILYEICDE